MTYNPSGSTQVSYGVSITPILNRSTGAIKQIQVVLSGSWRSNYSQAANDFGISAFGVEAIQLEN